MQEIVGVGSLSDHKLRAVSDGLKLALPDHSFDVVACDVDSGVGPMPVGDFHILHGAKTRAAAAFQAVKPAYGVGIEGGMTSFAGWWYCTSWVVIWNGYRFGHAGTGRTRVPEAIAERVLRDEEELGDVLDWYFGEGRQGRKNGLNHLLSNGTVSRSDSARDAVVLAVGSLLHP